MSTQETRLEDFGARGVVSPSERLKEYQEQCKAMSKRLQARFWLEVLERDREVRQMFEKDGGTKHGRRG